MQFADQSAALAIELDQDLAQFVPPGMQPREVMRAPRLEQVEKLLAGGRAAVAES